MPWDLYLLPPPNDMSWCSWEVWHFLFVCGIMSLMMLSCLQVTTYLITRIRCSALFGEKASNQVGLLCTESCLEGYLCNSYNNMNLRHFSAHSSLFSTVSPAVPTCVWPHETKCQKLGRSARMMGVKSCYFIPDRLLCWKHKSRNLITMKCYDKESSLSLILLSLPSALHHTRPSHISDSVSLSY